MTEDIFGGILAGLVEAVHVELAYEAVDVSVAEVLGQYLFLKVIYFFDGELATVGHPMDDCLILLVLQDLKALLDEVSHRTLALLYKHLL